MNYLVILFLFPLLVAIQTATEINEPFVVIEPSVMDASEDWKYKATFANVEFYWRHEMNKSSVNIKAVNGNPEAITIKVQVSGGGKKKNMTFYSIKPGKHQTSVFCASMKNQACAMSGVSISLVDGG